MRRLLLTIAGACALTVASAAQQSAPQLTPRFDVASVKRSPPYLERQIQAFVGSPQPGVWRLRDLPVASAVLNLYPGYPLSVQIVGAPDWFDSREWYDIEARTSPTATAEDLRQMGRALLADRFKLALHAEQRELPAFILTQRNDRRLGRGLKTPAIDCAAFRAGAPRPIDPKQRNADRPPCGMIVLPTFDHTLLIPGADWRLTAGDVPISQILNLLGNYLQRPVVDRTSLTQRFDIELQFSTEVRADGDNGPPIRAAIADQLGLQVQEGRAMVDVLVIDHIERPTEN